MGFTSETNNFTQTINQSFNLTGAPINGWDTARKAYVDSLIAKKLSYISVTERYTSNNPYNSSTLSLANLYTNESGNPIAGSNTLTTSTPTNIWRLLNNVNYPPDNSFTISHIKNTPIAPYILLQPGTYDITAAGSLDSSYTHCITLIKFIPTATLSSTTVNELITITRPWSVPDGVNSINNITIIGGGGNGGIADPTGKYLGGGGGAGGVVIDSSTYNAVTPGQIIQITAGAGANSNSVGGSSSFGVLTAYGGQSAIASSSKTPFISSGGTSGAPGSYSGSEKATYITSSKILSGSGAGGGSTSVGVLSSGGTGTTITVGVLSGTSVARGGNSGVVAAAGVSIPTPTYGDGGAGASTYTKNFNAGYGQPGAVTLTYVVSSFSYTTLVNGSLCCSLSTTAHSSSTSHASGRFTFVQPTAIALWQTIFTGANAYVGAEGFIEPPSWLTTYLPAYDTAWLNIQKVV